MHTWLAFQLLSKMHYAATRMRDLYQDKQIELRPQYTERMNYLLELIELGENMLKGCPYLSLSTV